jgi:FAD:protein FMN transferase
MEAAHVSVRRARPLLGTFVEIAVAGTTIDGMEAAVEAAFSAVAAVHRLMSFHEATSDVSRLNHEAASGAVRVHDWTYQVLETACDLHCRSAGIFDVSVAPALQRLGLLPGKPALSSPSPRSRGEGRGEGAFPPARTRREGVTVVGAEIKSGSIAPVDGPPHPDPLPASGEREQKDRGQFQPASGTHNAIRLLPENQVRFADPAVKIDLGGIAKGFAVDRAVETLRRRGVTEGLVNAGGDLRTFGSRGHEIAIRHPRHPDRMMCRVALCNAALASSGSRFDPVRSGHLLSSGVIDPATAMPVRSIHGATVCAPSCMVADAITKVVMNVGEAAAPILEHYGADALFVSAHGDVHMTAHWKNEVHLAA